MANRWLSVIGVGEAGLNGLSPAARTLLDGAETIIGGDRHLAMLPDDGRERLAWPSPLGKLVDRIPAMRGRKVAVLATGDPMQFGIGSTLVKHVRADEMTVVPALSAFSLAAARLGWPLQDCAQITLHGRPLETLALHVHPRARLIILSHDAATPTAVAAWLSERGFGESRLVALSHMEAAGETRHEATAITWNHALPDFNTLAVECIAGPDAKWQPRTAGLADDLFQHDGNITKREIRAAALAKLKPHPGALLWDIGAGCGSVAIEWMRASNDTKAIALEPRADRRALAAQNAIAFGVPNLDIKDLTAPGGLAGLPQPDAVFIGGGISEETLATAIAALNPGGRLLAHAVTLDSEALLTGHHARHGGELTRISIARAEPIGSRRGWRQAMPVTQWALDITEGAAP